MPVHFIPTDIFRKRYMTITATPYVSSSTRQMPLPQNLVHPFMRSAAAVLETMLAAPAHLSTIELIPFVHADELWGGRVEMHGRLSATLAVVTDFSTAQQIVERMTGIDDDIGHDLVIDALNELANMIGGKGKRELAQFELALSLPQSHRGAAPFIAIGDWQHHHVLPFETDLGMCWVEMAFRLPHERSA